MIQNSVEWYVGVVYINLKYKIHPIIKVETIYCIGVCKNTWARLKVLVVANEYFEIMSS